ncbi:hypothetical protein M501DRAFT_974929 [Patellaria atrata CBS 101060]|uniref:Cell wall mannoprotein PIR1-like C-terminal domain-containing protein n=1 Tax=Patellaria atrata CBS 101060 TaxID=1346257 RepID=A0A9P4VSE9_9PEZI|nr:hypothetical protein M501DRAFT_974929 [Patellaria atrata CBS 101060]
MRLSIALSGLAFATAVLCQAVEEGIAPDSPPPAGCETDFDGSFTLNVLLITAEERARRVAAFNDVFKREAAAEALDITLEGGVLHDSYDRTGAIVENFQFQFDGPPQAGTIYTGGFSVCPNDTLALGGSTIFYRCWSGNFANIYDRHWADQCEPVYLEVRPAHEPAPTSVEPIAITITLTPSDASSTVVASANVTDIFESTLTTRVSSGVLASITGTGSSIEKATTTSGGSSTDAAESATTSTSTGGAVPTLAPRGQFAAAALGLMGAVIIL